MTITASEISMARDVTRRWWVPVVIGVLWIVFAFVTLSSTLASVAAIATLFGVGFLVGGITQIAVAATLDDWKWFYILLGVLSAITGLVALAWPGRTFVVMAALVGWYLLFDGVMGVIFAISTRHDNDVWWLGLIISAAEIAIAVWAAGYVGRSISLLVVWVAAAALARGLSQILAGLALHGADREFKAWMGPTAA